MESVFKIENVNLFYGNKILDLLKYLNWLENPKDFIEKSLGLFAFSQSGSVSIGLSTR